MKEILVFMEAMQPFFRKVLFASFLTRYGKLLRRKCFVRVLCKEYHVLVYTKQVNSAFRAL